MPGGGGTVRNMDIDKNGNLWLAESGVGKIARVTISHVRTATRNAEGDRRDR